jgi:hypothetical protein
LVAAVERVLDDSERVFHVGIGSLPLSQMGAKHLALVESLRSGNLELGLGVLEDEAYGTRERVLDYIKHQEPHGPISVSLTASPKNRVAASESSASLASMNSAVNRRPKLTPYRRSRLTRRDDAI